MNNRNSWKRRLFRLSCILLAPLAVFAAMEVGLRWAGVGQPSAFFIKDTLHGEPVYRDNPAATSVYFTPALARAPAPFSFPARKEAGTYRIFVVGGSAAAGDPEPAFRFSRMLKVMLETTVPNQPVEVINPSITAVNSHVLRSMMKEIKGLQPDLVIFYLGHNEVVGPYGPGSLFGRFTPSRFGIAARTRVRRTRTGQWVDGLMRAASPSGRLPGEWQGMPMFLDHTVPPGDERQKGVYRHFERNLRAMINDALRADADVILCTVGANLRSCAPFASVHLQGLSASDASAHRMALERGGMQDLIAAAKLDPNYAETHYRLAKLLEAEGEAEPAARYYTSARDLDALRFRADSRINEIIRETADHFPDEHLNLLDIEASLAAVDARNEERPNPFLDHVHYTMPGNMWVAAQLHDLVRRHMKRTKEPRSNWSFGVVPRRLGWQPWSHLRISTEMQRRYEKPPFLHQWDHAADVARWQSRTEKASALLAKEKDRIEAALRDAMQQQPDDWFLLNLYGEFLLDQGDFEEAVTPLRHAVERTPHRTDSSPRLALALAGSGRLDEAVQVIRNQAGTALADESLGVAIGRIGTELGQRGATTEAVSLLKRALSYDAQNAGLQAAYGGGLLIAGRTAEAVEALEGALALDPTHAEAHNNLGSALARDGNIEEALAHFRTAVKMDPTYGGAQRNRARACYQVARKRTEAGDEVGAVPFLIESVTADPGSAKAMSELAMLFITAREPSLLNREEGLAWAEKAVRQTRGRDPASLVALAAAQVARGEDEAAWQIAEAALARVAPADQRSWKGFVVRVMKEAVEAHGRGPLDVPAGAPWSTAGDP